MPAHLLLALLAACGAPTAPDPSSSCDLSRSTLDGEAFVQLEVQGDRSETPNPLARMKFEKRPDGLHAMYTVGNGLHAYDYTCVDGKRDGEVKCTTVPDFKRACLSFEVNEEGSCSAEALASAGFDGDEEAIKTAIDEAKKLMVEARKDPQWKTFQLMNNNVGNTLMGMLYVQVDQKRCRLQVDDMFVTIFNGEKKEDFNPVGTNAFVRTDKEYLFLDCDREGMLVDLDAPELPADLSTIPRERIHTPGTPVYYHYAGPDGLTAEEGCTYAVNTWANWLPSATATAVETADGKVAWTASHTWAAADRVFVGNVGGKPAKGGFVHMERTKTCGDKTETIDVVCNAAQVADAP